MPETAHFHNCSFGAHFLPVNARESPKSYGSRSIQFTLDEGPSPSTHHLLRVVRYVSCSTTQPTTEFVFNAVVSWDHWSLKLALSSICRISLGTHNSKSYRTYSELTSKARGQSLYIIALENSNNIHVWDIEAGDKTLELKPLLPSHFPARG